MSFGFSVGDVVLVFKLIRRTVFICTAPTITQYEGLTQEARGLEEVLTVIESLECSPGQEATLHALKLAAQRCRGLIDDTRKRVDCFKALEKGEKASKFKRLRARLRWSLTMANDASRTKHELVLYRVDLRTQHLTYLMTLSTGALSADLQHTWFEAPVVLEDALGMEWRLPSECSWAMLRVLILEKFKVGPGASKVAADEYALYPKGDCSRTLSDEDVLLPGQRISMAMTVSQFELTSIDHCPTPNCTSTTFPPYGAGEVRCPKCNCSFHFDQASHYSYPQIEIRERKPISSQAREALFNRMRLVARSTRSERSSFKNIRIFMGTDQMTPLTYGKRCRMLLCSETWPTEVIPVKSEIDIEEDSQYAAFERYIGSMREQPGAPELILETMARDVGGDVPYITNQLNRLCAVDSSG